MTGIVAYVLSKNFTKKTVTGLGALKGSPCKIKSVVPTYSPLDPTVVISNLITLEWDSNNTPSGSPIYHEESIRTIDNGRAIYKVEYDSAGSSAEYLNYIMTFYDGTTTTFKVPSSSFGMKKKVVDVLPSIADADKNCIYLVSVPGKTGAYTQFIAAENDITHVWEWLSLGSTDVDMVEYQKKIDTNIIKSFPNYDPETKIIQPDVPNVVGAINEHIKALNEVYDYTTNKITNLTTHTKTSIVDALNEMGNIEDLEDYTIYSPTTIVDAINHANKTYKIDYVTSDKTKMYRQMKTYVDNRDGIGWVALSDSKDITIPRVDVKVRPAPDNGDYRTYDIYMGGMKYDSDDPSSVPFGDIKIPKAKIIKEGVAHQQYVEILPVQLYPNAWNRIAGTNSFWQDVTIAHKPQSGYDISVDLLPAIVCDSVSGVIKDSTNKIITVTVNNASAAPSVPVGATITYEGEIESLAGQYWLQIEGLPYDEARCGAKIEIEKSMLIKDVEVKEVDTPDVPYPGAQVGDKYIDMVFELADGSEKHAYIPCNDLFDPYIGKEAIKIEHNGVTKENTVYLKIYDPESTEALVQSDDGLRIMKAEEDQIGVVQLATNAEVLAATTGLEKAVTPYDLYNFAVNSESVDDQLEGLYVDPATTEHVNKTIIHAINELASAEIKKQTDADDGDIDTYRAISYPNGTTATPIVIDNLGDKIHIYKQIVQVDALTTITNPKDYIMYYLKQIDNPYYPGLYMWVDSAWKRVDDAAIIQVVSTLPTTDIRTDILYEVIKRDEIVTRYSIVPEKKKYREYYTDENGLHHYNGTTTTDYTWAAVYTNLSSLVASGVLFEDTANGIIYKVKDNNTGIDRLEYDFHINNSDLFYHYNSEWFTVRDVGISTEYIDELFIVD